MSSKAFRGMDPRYASTLPVCLGLFDLHSGDFVCIEFPVKVQFRGP